MDTLTDPAQLGRLIRTTRKNQNLTQEQLASVCGVGTRLIREVEGGKETCQIGKVLSILHMLGITLFIDGHSLDKQGDKS